LQKDIKRSLKQRQGGGGQFKKMIECCIFVVKRCLHWQSLFAKTLSIFGLDIAIYTCFGSTG
jgi:hypothetical protein